MNIQEEYAKKLVSADEAVKLVKDGDWVDFSQTCSFPHALDEALAKRTGELKDVKVRSGISMGPVQIVEQDPEHRSFTYNLWHCSGIDRKYIDKGMAFFNPMLFRNCGAYYRKGYAPVNVAMIAVPPMDKRGYFSFSLTNSCTRDILDAAEHIILEVTEGLPFVYGTEGDCVHISEVDYVVEGGRHVLTAGQPAATETDRMIANHIFPRLHDGMTLQIGIGGMPNALGAMIADSDLKDLGMHTELMSDGYLKLYEAGKITNKRKTILRGKGVFSVCNGSQELYDFLDRNIGIVSAPMSFVNDPAVIKQLDDFVSINGCIAADLYGQVCSESSGTRQISGTGGQLDFVTGAFDAPHGQSYLAMPSTFTDKKGVKHSTILPKFTQGDIITTPRTQTVSIVTEYGIADLAGRPVWQRAEALINIAHPDFREELIQAAEAQGIWRK